MRRILILALLLCGWVSAQANQRAQGFCEVGGQKVVMQGLQSTTDVQASYPQCTVTVYVHGTQTIATIYSDNNSPPTPLTNPFTANTDGSWGFYAGLGHYDVALSGGLNGGFATPFILSDVLLQDASQGAGTIPNVLEMLSGDGNGNAAGMPEKGTTVVSSVASVAWDEDTGLGRFDPRDKKYDGGILGPTPGLAMQDLANDIVCYQSLTSLHANVVFPPGDFPIGTVANPTLLMPTGAYYHGSAPNFTATGTVFNATYSNHLALHFQLAVSATCSDGNVHTNTATAGRYEGFSVHGCGEGGCVNVPGDSGSYPEGGPLQDSILIEDSQGYVNLLGADHNGGNGVTVAGQDTVVDKVWGFGNMEWYVFGNKVAGQLYNPTTDGWHCNVVLSSLDGTFVGPFETYGYLDAPGAEYMHVCATAWAGGDTHLGPIFSNRDQIGLVRLSGEANGRVVGGRIDGPGGEGILAKGSGDSYSNIDNSSACSEFGSIPKGTVFGPWVSSLGSGQTPGTYTINAVNAGGDTVGSGATLTLVIGSGGTETSVAIGAAGTGYQATPTFPVTGTGGTAAVIGGTTYQHCDKLDVQGANNSFVNVKNVFESFFGPDHSTGDIWPFTTGSTFDAGTVGKFEEIRNIVISGGPVNLAKGINNFRQIEDPAGGITLSGAGAKDFSNGTRFFAGDSSPASWTGPFTVAYIGQDIWIYGNDANTTLPVSAGWQTCSGYDLNLSSPQWYHFFVLTDDVFHTVGTGFTFKEQCDTIDQNHWWVNHAGNMASLPPLEQQGQVDSIGDIRAHALPALPAMTAQAGGTPGPNGVGGTYTYAMRVWGTFGTQTYGTISISQCLPLPGFVNNPCFQNLRGTLPEGWTHFQLFRQTSTDVVATPGMIDEVTMTAPQPVGAIGNGFGFEDTRIAPINSTVLPTAWLTVNMTGNFSNTGTTIPTTTAFPGVIGQTIIDTGTNAVYKCDADDHWLKASLPFATF